MNYPALCHVARVGVMAAFCLGLGGSAPLRGEATPIATIQHPEPVDFQRELLPILQKKCLACHNATDAESDLVLETPATILKGGSDGPAAVAGKPDESLMLALASRSKDPVMPPEDNSRGATPMTPEELALLKLWIEQGAKGEVTAGAREIQWKPLPPGVNPVLAASQSPDGRLVVVGRANQAWVYDVLLGRYVDRLSDPSLADLPAAHGQPLADLDLVQSLAFSHDSQWIALGGYRTAKLWRRQAAIGPPSELSLPPITAAAGHAGQRTYVADDAGQIYVLAADQPQPLATLAGHSGRITSLAVSPNGTLVASIGQDDTLRIWDAQHQATDNRPQTVGVHQLAWVNDHTLAAACNDNKLRLWTVDPQGKLTGEPRELTGHAQPVTAVARLADDRIVSGSQDGNVRVWLVESGETQRELNHGAAVSHLAATDSAKRLLSAGGDVAAKLWDLESGQLIAELSVDVRRQWQLQQRTLERQVANRQVDNLNQDLEAAKKRTTEEEESLKKTQEARDKAQQEVAKSKEQADKTAAERTTAEAQFAEAKEKLAVAEKAAAEAADDEAKKTAAAAAEEAKKAVQDAENQLKPKVEESDKAAAKLTEDEKALDSAQRSVETSEKALGDAKAQVEQLGPQLEASKQQQQAAEQRTQQADSELQSQRHLANNVAVAADGSVLASSDAQGNVALWRSADGKSLDIHNLGGQPIVALTFAADPSRLQAVTADDKLWWIDVTNRWQLAHTIGTPDDQSPLQDRITALSFSPDDQLLAIGGGQPSRGGELKIYRVDDATLVREIQDAHSDTIFGLAFSPDGKLLASCGADRFMKVFDVQSGNLVRTFEGHTHHVLAVGWRADGRVLVTGGADKVVKLWNLADGSQVGTIQGFGKEVTSVQFAGAEDQFFAACGDRNLYRCNMGGERQSIGSGQDFLYVVSANLLGKSVAFGGHDSIVRVVDDNGAQLAELKPSGP
jgi:WD40 repeat protein